jgi:hypothetical protein
MPLFFFVRHWSVQEGQGRSPGSNLAARQRRAFTPAVILLSHCRRRKTRASRGKRDQPGADARLVSAVCHQRSIIGRGYRGKQAHDGQHYWIWVRRELILNYFRRPEAAFQRSYGGSERQSQSST